MRIFVKYENMSFINIRISGLDKTRISNLDKTRISGLDNTRISGS